MAIKPILFNTTMVQAIMEGRKTVTRRKIDIDIVSRCDMETDGTLLEYEDCNGDFWDPVKLCRYQPGDILYVRETVYQRYIKEKDIMTGEIFFHDCNDFLYAATDNKPINDEYRTWRTRPSIHMPREAARIWLRVTNVRVERLQDISGGDLLKEGVVKSLDGYMKEHFAAFEKLWDSTIAKSDLKYYGWEKNPYVWVVEFEHCEKPEGE